MRRKRRKRNSNGTGLIVIIVCMIFGTIAYAKAKLNVERKQVLLLKQEVTKEIEKEEERAGQIEELEAYVQTEKYIEDMAREKFGLIYEDEIILRSKEK